MLTWQQISLLLGFSALTRVCPFGTTGSPARAGSSALVSPTHLVTSITLPAVANLVSCSVLRWWRARTSQQSEELPSLRISVERPVGCCFECYILTSTLGGMLCLILAFVCSKPLLHCTRRASSPAPSSKKRKFWPKGIPGAAIDNWFSDKAVGAVGALTGMLTGIRYFVWGMKEPDYTMKIMATGGVLA